MKRLLVLSALALVGCNDFAAARAQCAEKGACESEVLPTLVSSVPAANATQVDLATTFTLTFSEAMDPAVTLTLVPPATLMGPTAVDETTVRFTTSAPLTPETNYTATVTGKSTKGVALGQTQFSFTTRSGVDTIAPTVTTTPSEGATGVGVDTSLILVFSEPMNPASLTVSTQPMVDWGAVSWDATNTQARFESRAVSLVGSTMYTVVLSGTDVAGNALAASSATVHFTTTTAPDTAPPTVVSTQPNDTASGVSVDTAVVISFSETMQRSTAGVLSISPGVPCFGAFDTTNTVLTCQPNAQNKFSYSTTYTVTVNNAKDTAGNGMAAPYTFTFTTAAPPDLTAPTFVSIPADGTMNVELDAGVRLTFSEPMDTSSVQLLTLASLGPIAWSVNNTVASFTSTAFDPSTSYQVNVSGTDLAGNPLSAATSHFQFTTRTPPDITPPNIIGTQPGDNVLNYGVTADIQILFSEAMDPVTTLTSVTLSPAVTVLCVLDAAQTTLTCKHTGQAFGANVAYTMTVNPTKAKDVTGNTLSGQSVFHFTSASVPDTTPPTVVSVGPANNAKGIHEDTTFSVTFSEPMDHLAVQGALLVSAPTGHSLSGFSWSADNKTVSFSAGTFSVGQQVNWQVGTGAKDLSGNALATLQLETFRVAYQTTQTVEALVVSPTIRKTLGTRGAASYSADAASSVLSFAGQTASSPRELMRVIIGFDLVTLNSTYVDVVSATLSVSHFSTVGSPYPGMGNLLLERITASPTSAGAGVLYEDTPLPITGCTAPLYLCALFSPSSTFLTWSSANITAAQKTVGVGFDVAAVGRGKLTYRLRFDNDSAAGVINRYEAFKTASWGVTADRPSLSVTYRYAGP